MSGQQKAKLAAMWIAAIGILAILVLLIMDKSGIGISQVRVTNIPANSNPA